MSDERETNLSFSEIANHPELVSSQGVDLLEASIARASNLILSQQNRDGYWWYTLEANETINAEYIFLMHYLALDEPVTEAGLARQILSSQNKDGSWSLFHGGDGDLSATVESYFALKLAGHHAHALPLSNARQFILTHGGLTSVRVFTRIHLAMFGLIPWSACPAMPVSFMNLPHWAPVNIYSFSSWARATIVPLLIILDQKRVRRLPKNFLSELFIEAHEDDCDWSLCLDAKIFSWQNFFQQLDRGLFLAEKLNFKPVRKKALQNCERWIRDHIDKTEDIYPALAYGAMALWSLGYATEDETITKALQALRNFRVSVAKELDPVPQKLSLQTDAQAIYQQCCISPVWDTPWAGVAVLEAGVAPKSPALIKSGYWLLEKQILHTYGDWSVNNPKAYPGGWSFEFENEYFPDVDDTIQVLLFLNRLELDDAQTNLAFQRGLDWIISMQSDNGGWAAFDKNNTSDWVNRIPFSDHGACLDLPCPDITARALELFAALNYRPNLDFIRKALHFIEGTQEEFGGWSGRWGVNYIYGTWCVLQGLQATGQDLESAMLRRATDWLISIQNRDGGFGESPDSYLSKSYIPLKRSTASQTAWALLALIAAGEGRNESARKAARYLVRKQKSDGSWDEKHHTGTGFPGHFYIRYHGYRHYFPLMALGKYRNQFI